MDWARVARAWAQEGPHGMGLPPADASEGGRKVGHGDTVLWRDQERGAMLYRFLQSPQRRAGTPGGRPSSSSTSRATWLAEPSAMPRTMNANSENGRDWVSDEEEEDEDIGVGMYRNVRARR